MSGSFTLTVLEDQCLFSAINTYGITASSVTVFDPLANLGSFASWTAIAAGGTSCGPVTPSSYSFAFNSPATSLPTVFSPNSSLKKF